MATTTGPHPVFEPYGAEHLDALLVRPVFDDAPPPEAPRFTLPAGLPREWAKDRATLQAALDALRRL